MNTTVIFDLDGTLVDSVPDIAAAANRMLEDEGRPALTHEQITRFVGNGLPKLVERVMRHSDLPLDRHPELTQKTLAYYSAAPSAKTVPYPGIREALVDLRDMGCTLGLCTNKPEAPARSILDDLGLGGFFTVIIGGDTLPVRKPDPAPLLASLDAVPAQGHRLFVGDSEVDAETAQRAEVPFLLFTQGYRKSPVSELPHTVSYDHASDLPRLIRDIAQTDPK